MARTPKVILKGSVLFITTSVEEGLMFPPNPLIRFILLNCLAKAQMQHKVTVCHFLVTATHVHMIVVVENPCDLKDFMRVFKCESAHAINRLLGRNKRTIWCEGYDCPAFLNPDKVVEKIVYSYSNPAKDNLEESIDRYPGLSSWDYFLSGKKSFRTALIPRDAYSPLPKGELERAFYTREVRRLAYKRKKASFTIEPDAWMAALNVEDPEEREHYNQKIITLLRDGERESALLRAEEGKGVVGAKELSSTPIGTPYMPERTGIKTICLGTKEERISYIRFVRALIAKGREVFSEWKRGNYHLPYPPGLFPPSMPKRGNLLVAGFC